MTWNDNASGTGKVWPSKGGTPEPAPPASPTGSIDQYGITCNNGEYLKQTNHPFVATFNVNDFLPDELEAIAADIRLRKNGQ